MLDPGTSFPDQIHLHSANHDGFGSYADRNYGLKARKTADNYVRDRGGWNGREPSELVSGGGDGDDESGVSTPPLWRSGSPPRQQNHYRSMSPSSRSQAIARGQRELMEMVSRMPEGCYELSLKDIVEKSVVQAEQESFSEEKSIVHAEKQRREQLEKRNRDKKAQMARSGSMGNGGFLLKMVFPIPWGSSAKKKKKKQKSKGDPAVTVSNGSKDGRVSPRPLLFDGSGRSVDDEWWQKRFTVAGETESGGFSSNSGGSSKSSRSSSSRSSSRNSTRYDAKTLMIMRGP